jgi:hypothetical protein
MILHVESFRHIAARPSRKGAKPHDVARLKANRIRRRSKRGRFLEWCLYDARSVDETKRRFGITRPNVRTYLQTLNKIHGIGYELDASEFRVHLPPPFDQAPELVFR